MSTSNFSNHTSKQKFTRKKPNKYKGYESARSRKSKQVRADSYQEDYCNEAN